MTLQTEYVLFFSDPHCGQSYGLLNPATELDYAGPGQKSDVHKPEMTKWQEFIWQEIIVKGLNAFSSQIAAAPVTLVCGGDCIQGTRYLTHLVTPKLSQQMQIAADAFQYIFTQLNVKRVFLAYGTEAHVGIEGDAESGIVPLIDSPGRPVKATPLAVINVAGADVFIAHHGFYVGEANLRGNAARWLLQRRMIDDMLLLGKRPPALYLTAHVHRYLHISHIETLGGEDIESHAVVCPALCPMSGYARQVTRSMPILATGMVLITITDGKVMNVNRDYILAVDLRESYGYPDGTAPGMRFYSFRSRGN